MKLVTAIIRPERFSAVQTALDKLGISQLTLTDVWGQGHEPGHTCIYRGTTFQDPRLKRLKLEVAVADDAVDVSVETILRYAKTGKVGDGVILVTPLERFIRIRTGQCVTEQEQWPATTEPIHLHARRVNHSIALASKG